MHQEIWIGSVLVISLLLQLIGLTLSVLIDPYIRREHRKIMLIIIAIIFSLLAQNYVGYLLDTHGKMPYVRTLVGIYGYSVRPIIIVLLFYIVSPKRKYGPWWILIGINTAIHLTALFSDVCFTIDANNVFRRGPLGYSCHVTSGILLVYLVDLTLREYSRVRKSETWIPLFNALLIVGSVIMDSVVDYRDYPVTFLMIVVVSSIVFYYIWLHLQFVREHEQALMAEQRIQIMMSQIQPHFLYNTLSTIQALCLSDPDKAFDTLEQFGTYLRQNIDSLDQPKLIPVSKELEHTQIYAEIEMIRFPSLHVEYNIAYDNFLIPALTIQPLVENAIRHGVRICKSGLVSVITRREEDCYTIVIQDNGKGFDIGTLTEIDGSHIGLRNVQERVQKLCGGTMTIDSVMGEGTTITIRIPCGKETA